MNQGLILGNQKNLKLSQAIELFLNIRMGLVSTETTIFYKRRLPDLVKVLGDLYIDTISLNDLRLWRADLLARDTKYINHPNKEPQPGKLSPYTVHQFIRAARTFFKWLYAEGYLFENPASRLESVSLPAWESKGISKDARNRILIAAKTNESLFCSRRDYALILFIADTGCRRSGAVNLTINKLDIQNNSADIYEKGRGDFGKKRTVFYSEKTKNALLDWLDVRPWDSFDNHVFVSKIKPHKGLSPEGIYRIIQRAAKKAHVQSGYNPHNFRHAAVRSWLNNGMPLPSASQLAGHSSTLVTADIYGKMSDRQLKTDHMKYTDF